MSNGNTISSGVKFAFFGTGTLSVTMLDEMKKSGFLPKLVVTIEDKPQGRKLVLTPTPTKVWAEENNVPFIELNSLKTHESEEEINKHSENGYDVFIVASYGKIIPKNILEMPKHKTINVHPSLLPRLRGPSPIKSAILEEEKTGVTIIRLDEEMDHGPIISQKEVKVFDWPPYALDLENQLGKVGGEMLCEILPLWLDKKIEEKEQDHKNATYCKKIEKKDGEINLSDIPEKNLRKIRAFHEWPGAYFFDEGKRIIVKKAHIENGELKIERIVPEGKKEMDYQDYLRGKRN